MFAGALFAGGLLAAVLFASPELVFCDWFACDICADWSPPAGAVFVKIACRPVVAVRGMGASAGFLLCAIGGDCGVFFAAIPVWLALVGDEFFVMSDG